jgi:spermidine synthase
MRYRLEWRKGEPVISGERVDYVGGQLKRAWEEAFASYGLIGRGWHQVLLIGMGASLMQILAQTGQPPPSQVLILEKDPEIVRLQEAHFVLPLPYQVYLGDAAQTIYERTETFDGIFVDAFIEWEVPSNLLQKDFLQALHHRLNPKGLLLWNVLLNKQAKRLEALLRETWPIVRIRRIGNHHFFLAGNIEADWGWPF